MAKIRRNFTKLTVNEKDRFFRAVLEMKKNGSYDKYVDWHLNHAQHSVIGFLAWHRIMLVLFEEDLIVADKTASPGAADNMALPYWNWTVQNSADPKSANGEIWRSQNKAKTKWIGIGGNGDSSDNNKVTDGPFNATAWKLTSSPDYLRRGLGEVGKLPTKADIDQVVALASFDEPPFTNASPATSFRNALEGWITISGASTATTGIGLHNFGHVWVGGTVAQGTMYLTSTSPNDPAFYLHHAFIDKIWRDWQLKHPKKADQYPASGAIPTSATQPLPPWDGTTDSRAINTEAVWNWQTIVEPLPSGTAGPARLIGYRYDDDPASDFNLA